MAATILYFDVCLFVYGGEYENRNRFRIPCNETGLNCPCGKTFISVIHYKFPVSENARLCSKTSLHM